MTTDRKKLYLVSISIFVVLLLTLFVPNGSGRILAAIFLLPLAAVTYFLIKKRAILSINKYQILLIMAVIGILYLMFYYVSGISLGFTKTGYGLKADIIFRLTIPIAAIICSTEIIRFVLCAQKDKFATAFAYLICLASDILICSSISGITNFSIFMDVIGLTLFPGLLYNLLYNYLSARYGWAPNLVYRALTVWVFYLIPYGSAISDSLIALINMMIPIGIFFFIDSLYERKRRYALGQKSRFRRVMSKILTVVVVIIMIGTIMLVSNHFYYGSLVIATESMTGELNKGDVIIFERYEDQLIIEGQVIVFVQNKSMVVHRVADIKIINGNTYYYTKGDANEDLDAGFITDGDIVGLVNYKVPFIGFPTLWVRSLFSH